ncbi:hypothetical protein LBMAG42_02500 [Deltaproteobacteria bacterium]|nr:hypothetical protein LBMAG42_02500 [Deltaproteobacteria bacterium]
MSLPSRTPSADEVIAAAAAAHAPLEVLAATPVPAQITALSGEYFRIVALAPAGPDALVDAPVIRVVVHVDGRAWEFESSLDHDERGCRLRLPARFRAHQRRTSSRIAPQAGAAVLFGVGESVLRRPVIDFAAGGLGVEFTGSADEPRAGTALTELRFSLPVGAPITAAGVVRHVRPRASDGALVAGIDLIGLSESDARRLDAWVRGNTRTRKRTAANRAADFFSNTKASFAGAEGGPRTRAVVELSLDGLIVGLLAVDRDLTKGTRLSGLELWHDGQRLLRTSGEVVDVVAHRSRPLQARVQWDAPPADELARVGRLLRRLSG